MKSTRISRVDGAKRPFVDQYRGMDILPNGAGRIKWFAVSLAVAATMLMFFIGSATFTDSNLASAQTDLPLTPPNAPQNVSIVAQVNSLDVFWEPPVVDANNAPTGYIVDWAPGAQSAPVTFTTFGISNLIAGRTYSVKVIAINDAGRTYPKPVEGVPLEGAAVTAVQVDDGSITRTAADVVATLTNPESESQTIHVRYRTPPEDGTWSSTVTAPTSGTSADVLLSGLSPNTEYEVEASLDEFFLQDVASYFFTTHGPPAQPLLTLVPGEGTLTAHWTVNRNGATVSSYLLEWKPSSATSYTDNAAPAATASTHEITGLTDGEQYDARLTATTNYGTATSDEVSGTPSLEPVLTKLEFVGYEDGYILNFEEFFVNLNIGSGALTRWHRIRQAGGDWYPPFALVVTREKPTFVLQSITIGIAGGTEYEFQSVLSQGDEPPDWTKSAQLAFKTAPLTLFPPAEVSATPGDGEITVNWRPPVSQDVSSITGYVVGWEPADGDSESISFYAGQVYEAGPTERTYTIPGLINGVEYEVAVIAVDGFGNGFAAYAKSTPSTVPQSEPYELLASACNRVIILNWRQPLSSNGGSPITFYTIQWKSGDQEFYGADREKINVGTFVDTTIFNLENDVEHTFRIRASNVNGVASRLVTNPITMTTTSVPIWSEEIEATPREGFCAASNRYGNALADSVPVTVQLWNSVVPTATVGTPIEVFMRHRQSGAVSWGETQHTTVENGQYEANFDLTGLTPNTSYEIQASLDQTFPRNNSIRWFTNSGAGPTAGYPGGSAARVLNIEPSIRSVVVSPGDEVSLSVEVWGRQGLLDNGLADKAPSDGRPEIVWSSSGDGTFAEGRVRAEWRDGVANDREVTFVAPDEPGTVTVTASLADSAECLAQQEDETPEDHEVRCSAEIEVTVVRRATAPIIVTAPVNPAGVIPVTLSDDDGVAYAVLTPVEGGSFVGDGYSLEAGAGAVSNGEYIGVSMAPAGDASNVGMTWHRYTLGGQRYAISVIDADRVLVSDYALNKAVTACAPLPSELRGNIADIVLAAADDAGGTTVLSTSVKITPSGVSVCGKLSTLPATVAVGKAGSPPEVVDPGEDDVAEEPLPDTGGAAPSTPWLLYLLLASLVATVAGLAAMRRVRAFGLGGGRARRDGAVGADHVGAGYRRAHKEQSNGGSVTIRDAENDMTETPKPE